MNLVATVSAYKYVCKRHNAGNPISIRIYDVDGAGFVFDWNCAGAGVSDYIAPVGRLFTSVKEAAAWGQSASDPSSNGILRIWSEEDC